MSASSVNCETTSASPPTSSSERSKRPSSSSKIRSRATFSASRCASAAPSPRATPSSTQRPRPDLADRLLAHAHARLCHPLHHGLHVRLGNDDTSDVEAAHLPWQHLGSLLINRGLLTVDQVKQAFEEQR